MPTRNVPPLLPAAAAVVAGASAAVVAGVSPPAVVPGASAAVVPVWPAVVPVASPPSSSPPQAASAIPAAAAEPPMMSVRRLSAFAGTQSLRSMAMTGLLPRVGTSPSGASSGSPYCRPRWASHAE